MTESESSITQSNAEEPNSGFRLFRATRLLPVRRSINGLQSLFVSRTGEEK